MRFPRFKYEVKVEILHENVCFDVKKQRSEKFSPSKKFDCWLNEFFIADKNEICIEKSSKSLDKNVKEIHIKCQK